MRRPRPAPQLFWNCHKTVERCLVAKAVPVRLSVASFATNHCIFGLAAPAPAGIPAPHARYKPSGWLPDAFAPRHCGCVPLRYLFPPCPVDSSAYSFMTCHPARLPASNAFVVSHSATVRQSGRTKKETRQFFRPDAGIADGSLGEETGKAS